MMSNKNLLLVTSAFALAILSTAHLSAQEKDKYAVNVPGGLGFSDFKGYESWQTISVSHNDQVIAVILGNPAMIQAFQSGIPGNGKPFPDGARMAKVHWVKKQSQIPGTPFLPSVQHDVDFMLKDGKRFADSGGWGYAAFQYDAASDTFRPSDTRDMPPQGNDAKCGYACHMAAKSKDFVFTAYQHR